MTRSLGLLSWSTYLPPSKSVVEIIRESGGDPANYETTGWKNISVATASDHPLSMCQRVLTEALEKVKLSPGDLRLVISTGQTKDYPDSTLALDVMNSLGTHEDCIGFDLTQGCLSALTAMDIADDWLRSTGAKYAAIVSAERWAETVDKGDGKLDSIWGWGDGASALIVSANSNDKPIAIYRGSCYHTNISMAGHIRRVVGGTRFPVPAVNCKFNKREIGDRPLSELQAIFFEGYSSALAKFKEKFSYDPSWMICNQGAPSVVELLSYVSGVDLDRSAITGHDFGHVGCSDLVIGINQLKNSNKLKGNGVAFSCNTSTWGVGLIEVV